MVLKRYNKKRGFGKSKRPYRRRRPFKTIQGRKLGTNQLYHNFTRRLDYGLYDFDVDTTLALPTYHSRGMDFRLDMLPNYTDFSSLFDSYRINKIVLYFTFAGNSNATYDTHFRNMLPEMMYVIDDDDATAPASSEAGWNTLQEYSRSKFIQIGSKGKSMYTIVLYPSILGMAYESLTTTAYMPLRGKFIDMEDVAVPHYGLKYTIRIPRMQSGGNAVKFSYNISAKYYITCRFPR